MPDVYLDESDIDLLMNNLDKHQLLQLDEQGDMTLEIGRKVLETAL